MWKFSSSLHRCIHRDKLDFPPSRYMGGLAQTFKIAVKYRIDICCGPPWILLVSPFAPAAIAVTNFTRLRPALLQYNQTPPHLGSALGISCFPPWRNSPHYGLGTHRNIASVTHVYSGRAGELKLMGPPLAKRKWSQQINGSQSINQSVNKVLLPGGHFWDTFHKRFFRKIWQDLIPFTFWPTQ